MKYLIHTLLAALLLISCGSTKRNESYNSFSRQLITMTYNIHHGAPDNSKEVNLKNIADVIKRSGAEVIALQEVDINVPRSGNIDQIKELANILGMKFYFSKSIDLNGGEYGVAILSKYKLKNVRNELLPMPMEGEQRSVAMATIELPGKVSIEFAATHLDLNVPNRLAQVEFLKKLSKDLNNPFFVAGDYNAEPTTSEMIKLKEEFNLSCMDSCPLTFPVKLPTKTIDYVAYNQLASVKFKMISSHAMTEEYASDHLPVVVAFKY